MEVSQDDREKATIYLMEKMPEDILKQIWDEIQGNKETELLDQHHGFGTQVRNFLRDGGFRWGAIALDMEWKDLVKEAARLKFSKS